MSEKKMLRFKVNAVVDDRRSRHIYDKKYVDESSY